MRPASILHRDQRRYRSKRMPGRYMERQRDIPQCQLLAVLDHLVEPGLRFRSAIEQVPIRLRQIDLRAELFLKLLGGFRGYPLAWLDRVGEGQADNNRNRGNNESIGERFEPHASQLADIANSSDSHDER